MTVVALFGPGTLTALGLPEQAGGARPHAGGIVYVDPRLVGLGARAIVPKDKVAAFEQAGFQPVAFDQYDALRLSLGIPDGSRDLPVEKALLLENGFDELNGVDWKKGCFVGQELTARMKYRGLVRKRLMPVQLKGPQAKPGTPILLDGRDAGELRSSFDDHGIALLRLEQVARAAEEGKPLMAGDTEVIPHKPDWVNF
jgi:tRNA-modifying protein YgfZ